MDPFVRQVTAPLGILFPFPLLCPKLDSYMKPEEALRSAMQQTEGGGGVGGQVTSEGGGGAGGQVTSEDGGGAGGQVAGAAGVWA